MRDRCQKYLTSSAFPNGASQMPNNKTNVAKKVKPEMMGYLSSSQLSQNVAQGLFYGGSRAQTKVYFWWVQNTLNPSVLLLKGRLRCQAINLTLQAGKALGHGLLRPSLQSKCNHPARMPGSSNNIKIIKLEGAKMKNRIIKLHFIFIFKLLLDLWVTFFSLPAFVVEFSWFNKIR